MQVGILTAGLWRLRHEVGEITGMEPRRFILQGTGQVDAFAGWGHGRYSGRARRLARRSGKPYLAFEDGPLRSVKPGPEQRPMSLVVDRSGIYYDSRQDSDLTRLIVAESDDLDRAVLARDLLRRLRVSKYNAAPELDRTALALGTTSQRRILVLDQVANDASIRGSRANGESFKSMLAAALNEVDAEVIVKLHPEVLQGRRAGYFSDLRSRPGLNLLAAPVNPWSLLDLVDKVYTVSSGLGFEAALAGKDVVCFGSPYYSGWGFTEDRGVKLARAAKRSPLQVFSAFYLRYAHYFDAYRRHRISFEEAADQLAWLRDRFMEQDRQSVVVNVSRWKQASFNRLLDGPAGPPVYAKNISGSVALAKHMNGQVVVWASRSGPEIESACSDAGVPLLRAEDGFIRSSGLGAAFIPAQSLAIDRRGIYYDPNGPSDLEHILQTHPFPADLIARAKRLRETLIETGITKYNVHQSDPTTTFPKDRPIIFVPGQVEDDASIRRGSPVVRSNLDLLRAARQRNPSAFIVYKPHPDVHAGLRLGHIPDQEGRKYADDLLTDASTERLLRICDRVETMTSLTGFEALLRGKQVTTHGQPFYAGWGLTEDLAPVARRTRKLSLDELVAAALILYAGYLDPVSGLRCGPELLVERIAEARGQRVSVIARARASSKTILARSRYRYLAWKLRWNGRPSGT